MERPTAGAEMDGEEPLPPPPQATQTPVTNNALASSKPLHGPHRGEDRQYRKTQHHGQYPMPAGRRVRARRDPHLRRGSVLLTGAVVERVTVAVAGEDPLNVNDVGVIEHDIPGLPLDVRKVHCKLTVPVNP